MNILKRVLVIGFALLALGGFAKAEMIDQFTGEYWYDWIGNDAGGSDPVTEVGTMVVTSSSVSLNYLSSPNSEPGSFDFTYTNPTLDENGYLTMHTDEGPFQVLANGNFIGRIDGLTTNDPLSHSWIVRKAENLTLPDIVGDYAVFRHGMHGDPGGSTDEAEGVFGTAVFSTGTSNNWSIDTTLLNSSGESDLDATGNWTFNGAASTVNMAGMGSSDLEFKVGAGGLLMSTVIDGVNDTLAKILLVKKGTGRTVDDVVGRYSLQGFDSNTDGDEFWTTWGTLDIFSNGTWTVTTSNSAGVEDDTSNGTFTIDDDGTLFILDSEGTAKEGVINLDGDLLVLSDMNPTSEEVGIMLAVRPLAVVPEPSLLALLVLGSLSGLGCWFFRRGK